ncbi:MAG: cupin domain-containing protein [Acidobacteria bacterium]|nr:cupin domain-containing protein [Acidobacteriota bacterium]
MTSAHLRDMHRGWVVGDFAPTCYRTSACEVACQRFEAGDVEAEHVHRIATEITVIVSGRAIMAGRELTAGDILVLEPGDPAGFHALEPTTTLVMKFPSVPGDKYLVDPVTATPEPAKAWA